MVLGSKNRVDEKLGEKLEANKKLFWKMNRVRGSMAKDSGGIKNEGVCCVREMRQMCERRPEYDDRLLYVGDVRYLDVICFGMDKADGVKRSVEG